MSASTSRKVDFSRASQESLDDLSLPSGGGGPTDSYGAQTKSLDKPQVLDKLAHGGMSDLEKQWTVQMDFMMPWWEREWYQNRSNAPVAGAFETVHESSAPAHTAQPVDYRPLGAEGALYPEGIHTPQGLMCSIGMTGPQGLMAPRKFGGNPGHEGAGQSRGESQGGARQQGGGQGPAAGQQQHSEYGPPPKMADRQGGNSGESQATSAGDGNHSPQQGGGQSNLMSHTLWDLRRSRSPFMELLMRIVQLIKSLLGLDGGGYRGGDPRQGRR